MAPPTVQTTVPVPKKLHGKVVGAKGATIRDIESDYPGVKVLVPKRHDPSELITISGPADAVKRAVQRVRDISGELGDATAKERERADGLRKEKDALFDEAHHTNNPEKRRRLMDAAHAKKREFEAEEAAAALRIFRARNSGCTRAPLLSPARANKLPRHSALHVLEAATRGAIPSDPSRKCRLRSFEDHALPARSLFAQMASSRWICTGCMSTRRSSR